VGFTKSIKIASAHRAYSIWAFWVVWLLFNNIHMNQMTNTEQVPVREWIAHIHAIKTCQQVSCHQNKRFGCFLLNPTEFTLFFAYKKKTALLSANQNLVILSCILLTVIHLFPQSKEEKKYNQSYCFLKMK